MYLSDGRPCTSVSQQERYQGYVYVRLKKKTITLLFLPQLKAVRPKKLAKLSKTKKTVTRCYGGSRCAACVRER